MLYSFQKLETRLLFGRSHPRVSDNVMLLILEILTSVYLQMPLGIHYIFQPRKIILESISTVRCFCSKWAYAIFGTTHSFPQLNC